MTPPLDQEETRAGDTNNALAFARRRPSWMAVAALMVSVAMPACGWMISLSTRVAVLEADNNKLSTAAVEIAALKQELNDFRREYEQDRVNRLVIAERQAK